MAERKHTRRGFLIAGLGFGGGLLTGASINTKNNQESQIIDAIQFSIKKIGERKLTELNDTELKPLISHAAYFFAEKTGIYTTPSELVERVHIYKSSESFIKGVQEIGDPGYKPELKDVLEGEEFDSTRAVLLNLEKMDRDSELVTNFPIICFLENLYHEWGHSIANKRTNGEILGKKIESFQVNGVDELWTSYCGGVVYTQNGSGYNNFDEAWNQLITENLVIETLQTNQELLLEGMHVLRNDYYSNMTDTLQTMIKHVGKIDNNELIRLHKTSDFENLISRIGATFTDEALSMIEAKDKTFIGNRNEEEKKKDRDFIIGKYFADLLGKRDWETMRVLFKFLKK